MVDWPPAFNASKKVHTVGYPYGLGASKQCSNVERERAERDNTEEKPPPFFWFILLAVSMYFTVVYCFALSH